MDLLHELHDVVCVACTVRRANPTVSLAGAPFAPGCLLDTPVPRRSRTPHRRVGAKRAAARPCPARASGTGLVAARA